MSNHAGLPGPLSASRDKGMLQAWILSVHDVPSEKEQPLGVSLSACGVTVQSGPPVARHKGGNSFRFSSSPTNKGEGSDRECLALVAPLGDLYKSTLTVRVVFADPSKTLAAEYDLNEMHVKQSSWLILQLKPEGAGSSLADPAVSSSAMQSTIRLKLQLHGPYRKEVAALVALFQTWFRFVDSTESGLRNGLKRLPMPDSLPLGSKALLIPAVPALAGLVVAAPVLLGLLMVGFPVLGPLMAIVGFALLGVATTGGFLLASSQHGRAAIGQRLAPVLDSPVGQSFVYDLGPRPSPVSFARQLLPDGMWGRLAVSLLIDLVGSASYLVPLAGEVTDIVWAPLQTTLVMAMYDQVSPNLKYVSFFEELLIFTDIVPTATLGWCQQFGPTLLAAAVGSDGARNVAEVASLLVPHKQ